MSRPRILDLFCCAGGAAEGYFQAGFDVVGVDIKRHKRYPFPQLQLDVVTMDPRFVATFDAIHASPPCQFGTELNSDKSRHVNLIPVTRKLLKKSGLPYVIENVRGVREHLFEPVSLFGTMFDCHMVTSTGQRFVLSRERVFETNWSFVAPADPGPMGYPIANIFGGHLRARAKAYRTGKGTGRTRDFIGEDKPALARQLMRMPWASMAEMSEAVPPDFTHCLGLQLRDHINAQRSAA